jgi:hypothetical protein
MFRRQKEEISKMEVAAPYPLGLSDTMIARLPILASAVLL